MQENDLISRVDVLDLAQTYGPATYDMPYGSGDMIIRPEDVMALSAVDAVPVRHEKWAVINAFRDNVYDIAGHRTWSIVCQCSGCGFAHHFIESHMYYVFCPHCGAKMDGGDDDATD